MLTAKKKLQVTFGDRCRTHNNLSTCAQLQIRKRMKTIGNVTMDYYNRQILAIVAKHVFFVYVLK